MLPSRFLPLLACLALTGAASALPPTLTTINVINGSNQNQETLISYATLAAAANEADPESDSIEFRVKSVIAGSLDENEGIFSDGRLRRGETWFWRHPAGANGVIDAFRVRAFAAGDESIADVIVQIDVTPVDDRLTVTASDVTVAEDSGAFTSTNWATGSSGENAQTLAFALTNSNTALFSVQPAISSTGTLTFTPAPNENGSATFGVRVTPNGGLNQSVIQNYTITVTAQPDAPTIAATFNGTSTAPFSDASTAPGGEVGPAAAQAVFSAVTIADVDHNKPNADNQVVIVTVDEAAEDYGTFALPGATVANVAGGKTYTLAAQSPSAASTALLAATFTPLSNAHPVGLYDFDIDVTVRDSTSRTASLPTTPLYVRSVNDSPTANASLAVASISDAGPVSPFRILVNDVDLGDTFSVTITETGTVRGALSATTLTGTAAQIAAAVQALVYTPFQQSANVTATLDFSVTDVHPDTTPGSAVVRPVSLPILFVNDPPEFTGVTTALIRMTDDPGAPLVFPFSSVSILDGDPNQSLTVTLLLGDPSQGSFTGPDGTFASTNVITGTVAEITTKLRAVRYVPTPGRIPVNSSETVTITIRINDGTVTVSNNQTQVEVTAVDGAPSLLYNTNPVFPLGSAPALIDPSTGPKPFALVIISDIGQVEVTVSLDTAAKGELSNLGGFVETPAGSRSYRFTGTDAAAQTAIQAINYDINPNFLFPPNQPGRTDFTITASDSALNISTRTLPILLKSDARGFLVTSLLDDETVAGTLRHAVNNAANNDVIVFALPSYPATIRLKKAKGPLVLTKHLSFRGPGADKLTISGDSNANAITDPGDVQIFRIFASAEIRGLRLARGFSDTGGAAFIGRLDPASARGSLIIEDCVISNCLASQWGGAVDVFDGQLTVARCAFENNALNASSGLGGGAVSLYTNAACTFTNSTFSGNSQAAPTGFGGGAIYVENDTPTNFVQTNVTHCTFAGNIDASNSGSSLHNNVSNSRVLLRNNVFADFSARNLKVAGGAEILSGGGNISNDNTTTDFIQGGVPQLAVLLNQLTDKRNLDPKLAPLANVEGNTRGHRLLPDSPAINAGVAGFATTDQRGVIRNASCDMGALDANALGKLIIHEIYPAVNPNDQFVEFYMPRDQATLDLTGYEVWIDGTKRHTFGALVVTPGHGLVLADTTITAAGSTPVIVADVSLALLERGRIELRTPAAAGNKVVEAVSFVAAFANKDNPASTDNYSTGSITLAPQYQGAAFAPHRLLQAPPNGGVILGATGSATSPGADSAGTPFGEANAYPIATLDNFELTEDVPQTLAVRANDLDADGSDELFIVDLNPTLTLPVPASGKSTITTTSGATVTITPATAPLRGTALQFDPRVAFNYLPEGARFTDTFTYSIVDVGGGAVGSFADGGGSATIVSAPAHRLASGATVTVRDAGISGYNAAHVVTVLDEDRFSIPVAFTGNPPPLQRGRWQAADLRSPSARSQALVQVSVLGRNDPPTPAADLVATNEDTVLRVFGDPRASSLALDTDPLYPAPRTFNGTGILANDTDPDTDASTFTSLKVIGVCQAKVIGNFSGTPGASPVTVTAPAHGLVNGTTVLISGYGGHPSYNGYHVVTVTGTDTFTLPVAFVDNAATKGLWTVLTNGNRLATTSKDGAEVTLEIRAGQQLSREGAAIRLSLDGATLTYDPTSSAALQALAFKERVVDTFVVTVFDGIARVNTLVAVLVEGRNDSPSTNNLALTINEETLLELPTPQLLLSGLDIDQNTLLPDNRRFLDPVDAFPTNVFAAKVNVLLDRRDGGIDSFAAGTPGTTAVLGWLILGETLSPLAILGFVIASVGVWLVNRGG